MMLKKIAVLAIGLAMCMPMSFAQNGLAHLPADASLVVHVNPKNLNEKVNLKEFQQLEVFNKMMDEMSMGMPPEVSTEIEKLITDPTSFGIAPMESFYAVLSMKEESTFMGLLLQLSDQNTFTGNLQKYLGGEESDDLFEDKGSYQKFNWADDRIILWNDNMAFLCTGELQEPENWWEVEEQDYDLLYQQLNMAISEFGENVINKKFAKNMAGNSRFTKAGEGGNDIHLWMNYEDILGNNSALMEGMGTSSLGAMAGFYKELASLYKGTFVSMRMNFNEGEMKMETNLYAEEEMMDLYKGFYKHKFEKDLLKYIDASNLLGYYSFSLNIENTFEGMADMMFPILEQDPSYGPMFTAAMGALDVIIDQESLYELFGGDFVFAVTGIQEYEKVITTYEYDENFDATEIQKTEIERLPKFTVLAPFGNRENLMKLMNLAVKTNVLNQTGNYFSVADTEDLGMNIYLAPNDDDILILSNDDELMGTRLNTGFGTDKRLASDQQKWLKKNSQTMFWDVPLTVEILKKLGMEDENPILTYLSKENAMIDKVVLTSPKKIKGSVYTQMSVTMKDKSENILTQMMNLINEMAMESMGGSKM